MKRKDILVTGGAGYIGSHTIVELYNSGYRPIVVDNLCNSSLSNIKGAEKIIKNNITFYQIDCTDNSKINNELGWFPLMNLESALKTAWRWERLKSTKIETEN